MESKLSESDLTPATNKKLVTVQSFHWLNNHQELAIVYLDADGFPETVIFLADDFRNWAAINYPGYTHGNKFVVDLAVEAQNSIEYQIGKYLIERLNLRAVAEVERLKRVIENMKREAEEALNELNKN